MKFKFYPSLLIIILIIQSTVSFDFENFNYKEMTVNPYRVLGIAPWKSMKEIKKRYNSLLLKYHPDKSKRDTAEQFRLIQTSYEKIKKERSEKGLLEDSIEELTFFDIAKKTISQIIWIEIIFSVIYYSTKFWYDLQYYLFRPLFVLIGVYAIIDRVIPHYFYDGFYEFIWICIISSIIIFQEKVITFIWNKIIDKRQ